MNEIPQEADAVIAGSGLAGLWTAFHLTKLGVKNVVIFDRGPLGGVASPRSGGILRHHYNDPLLIEMAILGRHSYSEFRHHTGTDAGYTPSGYFLGVGESHSEWLEENVKMVRSMGVNTDLITAEKTREFFPQIDPAGWSGAIAHDQDTAYVQPQVVVRALIRVLVESGVTLVPGCAVVGVEATGGHVSRVWTENAGFVKTSVVVNAAGAWGAKVASAANIALPIAVKRLLQIFEVRPTFRVEAGTPALSSGPLDLYNRPNPGNRLLVGFRTYFDSAKDPDDVKLVIGRDGMDAAHQRYAQLVPASSDASIYQGWAGIDGDSPDFQPIIGPVPGLDGYMCAVGLSAHGFKIAPVIGRAVAEQIAHREYRTLDVQRLSVTRFERGELFPTGYKQMGA